MGGDAQIALTEMAEDRDLHDQVRLELRYLKPIEMKKPTEEGSRG
jgi:hypothetical protein